MKTKALPVILILSCSVFHSCKKNETPANNGGNSGNNSTVVYNVKKQTMLDLVNQVRKTGCTCGTTAMPAVGSLTWNDQLAKAAYDHSKEMNDLNYFSHTGQDGSSAGDRIHSAGYEWITHGENIAKGYPDEQAVVDAWLGSEAHCKNIMNNNFKEIGVGKEGYYWTQVFAAK